MGLTRGEKFVILTNFVQKKKKKIKKKTKFETQVCRFPYHFHNNGVFTL